MQRQAGKRRTFSTEARQGPEKCRRWRGREEAEMAKTAKNHVFSAIPQTDFQIREARGQEAEREGEDGKQARKMRLEKGRKKV